MRDPNRDRSAQLNGIPIADMRQLKAAAALDGKSVAVYMRDLVVAKAAELRKQNGKS